MTDFIITGGRVIDGTGAPAYAGSVLVEGGRIAATGAEADARASNRPNLRRIDAAGQTQIADLEAVAVRIVLGQRHRAERRVADTSARIDARPDQEGQVKGIDGFADARHPGERRDAGIAEPACHHQALDDEGAVDTGQRNDVAYGRHSDEIEPSQQIRRGPPGAVGP